MAKREEDPEVLRLLVGFLRLFAKLTQRQFADASGLQQVDISHYESGKHRPREKNLQRMAAAAGFPWGLVGPLRRFFAALLVAIRWGRALSSRRSGRGGRDSQSPEDLIERAVLEAAWAAVATYRAEEEAAAAAEEQRRKCPEELIREAGQTWEALKRFPVGRRRHISKFLPQSCRTWPLAEQICEASLKAAADSPEEALESAALALDVAELLLGDEGRSVRLAWCWGHLGNARRVATDFDGADEAFARARQLWSSDPNGSVWLPGWHLLSLEASLRREQRRFPEALKLLDQAMADCDSEPAATARFLLQKEHIFEVMGDIPAALAALAEAAPHVATAGDPHLLFIHRFNEAKNLCHLQRFSEAAVRLPETAELAQGAELAGLRVAWLTSRVAAGQGRKAEALAGLEQVRQRFTDLNLPYEAALSSLEIAVLWLEEGRTAEVQALALTMAWIFDAKRIHREALAALKLFRDAAEQEEATVELARRVIAELEKAEGSAAS